MPARSAFDYALVRVVPRVEREEFVNVGVVVFCHAQDLLAARVELAEARLCALHPGVDLDLVRRYLDVIPRLCRGGDDAGPIGKMPIRERWHWLTAPSSTIIQTSAAHVGLSDAPEAELARLFTELVACPAKRAAGD
ncbi:MAG: DUF3037 domain-containing protein [Polyangiaceae bacterium]